MIYFKNKHSVPAMIYEEPLYSCVFIAGFHKSKLYFYNSLKSAPSLGADLTGRLQNTLNTLSHLSLSLSNYS